MGRDTFFLDPVALTDKRNSKEMDTLAILALPEAVKSTNQTDQPPLYNNPLHAQEISLIKFALRNFHFLSYTITGLPFKNTSDTSKERLKKISLKVFKADSFNTF